MHASTILARIAARTGVAVWRHRVAWVTSLVVIGALGAYQLGYAGPSQTAGGADCADTAMEAVSRIDDRAASAAWNCLGPTMRRNGEQEFVRSLHDRGELPSGHVSRVGDQRLSDGSRIVFYTIEAGGQVVGYIVYLDANGKVRKIE